jgi:hypothetical protein
VSEPVSQLVFASVKVLAQVLALTLGHMLVLYTVLALVAALGLGLVSKLPAPYQWAAWVLGLVLGQVLASVSGLALGQVLPSMLKFLAGLVLSGSSGACNSRAASP